MRSKRRLRAELLERRLLLSADLADFSAATIESAESHLYTSSAYVAQDAGSSFGSAANIGSIEGTRAFRGSLGFFDPSDTIAFTVVRDADVQIDLTRMRANADLYLTDRAGRVIGLSRRPGSLSESIDVELPAGEYYITVLAASFWSNPYRLTVTATLEPESPVLPPSLENVGGSSDWNLNLIAAPESWAAGYSGQGVTVAVVDSGVDLDHPGLMQSLYVNPGEIPGNGIDDDGNGFVDDVTGYDFADNDSEPDDPNGHGTHVAGTIAAVAPGAKILPVRVLGAGGGGSSLDVAAGIRYAADMGAQIINLSLGGGYSAAIESAIRYAQGLGALIVSAAGNGSAAVPGYPARFSSSYDHVISVGAHTSSGSLASFSNRVGSSGAIQVDAPGVGIYSTYVGGGYAFLSGTSMAAPHVAGLAALTLSAQPNLTAAQLRALLTGGVTDAARGSDSAGMINGATTVAYAAAGLTSVPNQGSAGVVNGNQQASTTGIRSSFAANSFLANSFAATPSSTRFAGFVSEGAIWNEPLTNVAGMNQKATDAVFAATTKKDERYWSVAAESLISSLLANSGAQQRGSLGDDVVNDSAVDVG